jgi:hypothetical protein
MFYMIGLPRSGSTVLASILNQHPEIHVTPTSPLLDQLVANQDIYHSLQAVRANPVPGQLENITHSIINGMYSHIKKPIIIDKNRGWGKNVRDATTLLGKEMKMIATTRSLPAVMESWLRIIKKNPNSFVHRELKGLVTDARILSYMWEHQVKDCVESLHTAIQYNKKNVLIVDYDALVDNPVEQLNRVVEFTGASDFTFDLNNIKSETKDDDLAAWGIDGMHTVQPSLKRLNAITGVLTQEQYVRFKSLEKSFVGVFNAF